MQRNLARLIRTSRHGAILAFVWMTMQTAWACNVPVFRYALERWPPEAHLITVTADHAAAATSGDAIYHSNIWVEAAPTNQTHAVRIMGPAPLEAAWYEGPWEAEILTRIVDSPLRRQIAHEHQAAAVMAATNAAVMAILKSTLEDVEKSFVLPEEDLDFDDGNPEAATARVPLRVKFSLHRVSRDAAAETFFVKQITGIDASFADPDKPLVAFVFGQGRMIPLPADAISPNNIMDLCGFLCSACSCQVKALNPGIDLLFTANWGEALYRYPNAVQTVLPNGQSFRFGGTGEVQQAAAPTADTDVPASCATPGGGCARRPLIWALAAAAAAVLLYAAFRARQSNAS